MNAASPKIAIIGAGAVGGYYGARVAQHGHEVHFLLRSDYQTIRRDGLSVHSPDGDFHLPPDPARLHDDPRNMPAVDLVIVTLKTTSNDQYKPLIAPLLGDSTAILTLQNGLGNEEQLAQLFGADRILGGMAFVCINRIAPGVIRHIDHGLIRLGEFGAGPSPRASWIADLFSSSKVPCEVLGDLRFGRWSKLVWNVPFNGLGALLDLTTDRILAQPDGTELAVALMREVIAIAEAIGVPMPADMIDRQIRHTATMGPYRSSMQVDRQERRPLEIESIVGEPLRQAQRVGVRTPALRTLYQMLRLLD